MTPLLFFGVALAGGLGAATRYLADLAITRWLGNRMPWGILVVNVTGAFALGLLSGGLVDVTGRWILGVGLLGGYTTFSSVAVTTVALADEGRTRASLVYAIGTFAASVGAASTGLAVSALLLSP